MYYENNLNDINKNFNEEKVIQRDSYYTLTNKRLILGDQTNSIFLSDIMEIKIIDYHRIQLILRNSKKVILNYGVLRPLSAIDEAISVFTIPFEVGTGQEERATLTSYWAALLTMAVYLFGQPDLYIELKPRNVWCNHCSKYVEIPGTNIEMWKIECPICGRKGLLSKSPEDRIKEL